MTYLTDWGEIAQTDEYQNDMTLVMSIIFRAVGEQVAYRSDPTFLYLVGHLACIRRYFIRHMTDLIDIDETPRLDLMQQEIGLGIPITNAIPIAEWLRQSRSWFGYKGTKPLLYYIGDLINSPISVSYPRDLFMQLSSGRGKLSGAVSNQGVLPIAITGQGRIRDGIYWANYVYVVVVEQAQNVVNFTDAMNLLMSVHPGGMKMFTMFESNYICDPYENGEVLVSEEWTESYIVSAKYATISNGFKLSSGQGQLSMQGGDYTLTSVYDFLEITPLWEDSDIPRLSNDQFLHSFPTGKPWMALSRFVGQGDGTYLEVFSDTDPIVYENVSTNMGLFQYPISYALDKTFQELQHCAMLNDQQNMRGMFMQDLLLASEVDS